MNEHNVATRGLFKSTTTRVATRVLRNVRIGQETEIKFDLANMINLVGLCIENRKEKPRLP